MWNDCFYNFSQLKKEKTVEDIWTVAKNSSIKLLSDYDADFWKGYLDNSARYDKIFKNLYRKFKPYDQNLQASTRDVLDDFVDNVYNHLLLHHKRYSELYRINIVPDDSYSIIDNYDVTETMQKQTSDTAEDVTGAKSKAINNTVTDNIGQKSKSHNETITDTIGETERSEDTTITDSIGARSKSNSVSTTDEIGNAQTTVQENRGAGTDTTNYTQGQQANTSVNKVAPYDSENFYNEGQVNDTIGNRQDTTTQQQGARTNTTTTTEQARTDEHSVSSTETEQARTDSHRTVGTVSEAEKQNEKAIQGTDTEQARIDSHTTAGTETEQARTDTHEGSGTEAYTLRKKGNIGVMTSTDVMKRAKEFWTEWDFYSYVFSEIARELLIA